MIYANEKKDLNLSTNYVIVSGLVRDDYVIIIVSKYHSSTPVSSSLLFIYYYDLISSSRKAVNERKAVN